MVSGVEWIWVIVAVLVLFGASRLPLLGRNLGQGIKEFKKGIKEASGGDDKKQAVEGKDVATPKAVEPNSQETIAERRD